MSEKEREGDARSERGGARVVMGGAYSLKRVTGVYTAAMLIFLILKHLKSLYLLESISILTSTQKTVGMYK